MTGQRSEPEKPAEWTGSDDHEGDCVTCGACGVCIVGGITARCWVTRDGQHVPQRATGERAADSKPTLNDALEQDECGVYEGGCTCPGPHEPRPSEPEAAADDRARYCHHEWPEPPGCRWCGTPPPSTEQAIAYGRSAIGPAADLLDFIELGNDLIRAHEKMLAVIKREGFVFDGTGGDKPIDQWEKLTFTFYTSLVSLSERARMLLADDDVVDEACPHHHVSSDDGSWHCNGCDQEFVLAAPSATHTAPALPLIEEAFGQAMTVLERFRDDFTSSEQHVYEVGRMVWDKLHDAVAASADTTTGGDDAR